MSEQKTDRPLVFSVVEDDGENVTIEISEEDYRRDLEAGIDEDATLKPGRYKMKRVPLLQCCKNSARVLLQHPAHTASTRLR